MKQFDMGDNKVAHNLNGATFFVKLPTKGAFYPEEHPFYNKEKIEVKMLTTKEEEILTILAEECAELIQEIMKLKRKDACKFPTASFVKEVGDVYVILE